MRKYFSLIIPTHNAGAFITQTLESVVAQHFASLEVIIADDRSTDDTVELCHKYDGVLDMHYVSTTGDFKSPGNTRQTGLDIATGEWIMFMDHDDMLSKNALKEIKALIRRTGADKMVCTNLAQIFRGMKKPFMYMGDITVTWLHGKAYNKDNLLDKYGIHFERALWSHEDLFFNQQIWTALYADDVDIEKYCDKTIYTYLWVYQPDSLSRSKENGKSYILQNFKDYLYALTQPLVDFKEAHPEHADKVAKRAVSSIPFLYFYVESFKYNEEETPMDVIGMAVAFLQIVKELSGLTPEEMVRELYADPDRYNAMRSQSVPAAGSYIETESLADFVIAFGNATKK